MYLRTSASSADKITSVLSVCSVVKKATCDVPPIKTPGPLVVTKEPGAKKGNEVGVEKIMLFTVYSYQRHVLPG